MEPEGSSWVGLNGTLNGSPTAGLGNFDGGPHKKSELIMSGGSDSLVCLPTYRPTHEVKALTFAMLIWCLSEHEHKISEGSQIGNSAMITTSLDSCIE